MNITDTAKVLAKIQAFNNRTFDQPAIQAWHDTIGDLDLTDSLSAVSEYFRESKEWIMPSDIRYGVKKIREARIEKIRTDIRIREEDEDYDNIKLSVARKKHLYNLVASGTLTPEQYYAYHAGTFSLPNMPKAIGK